MDFVLTFASGLLPLIANAAGFLPLIATASGLSPALASLLSESWLPTLPSILAEQAGLVGAAWPAGGLGAFLLFLAPVGGGIPLGVIVADRGGVPPLGIALLYLLSDIALAITIEPIFKLALRLGRRFESLGRVGQTIRQMSAGAGLEKGSATSALSLIFVAFAISPTTGRAAAAAVGHGFFRGWTLAITGDMFYFGLLMASTLWLSSTLADDRLTIVIALAVAFVLPMLLQRMRRRLVAQTA